MTLKELQKYLEELLPIEKIPLTWDATVYTSKFFNKWVSNNLSFAGWEGDLPTEEEVAVMVKLLEVKHGNSLLDVACGYGRHALLLAGRQGLKVTGIDISPGLVKTAKRFAKEKGLKIIYEVRHGRDLKWEEEFDYAIIAFNSFSLFSPEDAPVVLQGIHKALKKNGRIFMDLDNKPFNCRYGTSYRDWCTWPEGLILQKVCFHRDISVEVCRDLSLNTESEQVDEFISFKRIYSKDDICNLLSECGFHIDKIYGGWDLSPLDENSPKMVLVGVKSV
ncbi:MAG: class I SAM-dependent methyltransferase [Deltaproteobacteria bacterium]|nr:class I SAM-dependent methyltransferase [Deltaproteobacteria bacterium]